MVSIWFCALGSSPLTRGKPPLPGWLQRWVGLIPAHAGKTRASSNRQTRHWAHPRSRGENRDGRLGVVLNTGLIPAHAGKTILPALRAVLIWAHPRSRGENCGTSNVPMGDVGSSPLTRGKPAYATKDEVVGGLIPAHAGKTLPDLRFYCADRSDLGKP